MAFLPRPLLVLLGIAAGLMLGGVVCDWCLPRHRLIPGYRLIMTCWMAAIQVALVALASASLILSRRGRLGVPASRIVYALAILLDIAVFAYFERLVLTRTSWNPDGLD